MNDIRVRIAPSPSGFLHIGTAKMALMNWLYARKMGGAFVLRLEDTDAERTDEAFVQAMCEGFDWLGIEWDEGPPFGSAEEKGEYGPYRQSERLDLHRRAVAKLLDEGKAYRCFCTKEELDAERERARAEKLPWKYSGKCRGLSAEDVAAKGDIRNVVRFKVDADGETVVRDLVQGDVTVRNAEFDDFVIAKPNGDPLFHLAVVVDDGEMKVSHVIRGDDHLTNASKHVMLFEALGYDVPHFAHLPMVLDERGKKFSKREHGANVLDWREDGFLPEALLNYVALLGWTAGDDKELYTLDELVETFSFERLGKSAAKFDMKKFKWLNGQHIRLLPIEELRARLTPILTAAGFDTTSKSVAWLTRMTEMCQKKLSTLNDIVAQTDFFFVEPAEYEVKALKKQWLQEDSAVRMTAIQEALVGVDDWTETGIKAAIEEIAETTGLSFGKYVHPMRLALTGKSIGPGLFELAELLGRDTCAARMAAASEYIKSHI